MKKRGPQERQKKTLSAKGLLELSRKSFDKITIPSSSEARGKKRTITLPDCLMSGLAVFGLKYSSLLSFDQNRNEERARHNLKTLYGIEQAPSDTYMREQLDEVDPKQLRENYLSIFEKTRKGKLLEQYRFLGGYLALLDGTQVFHSEDIHCSNCCQKNHRDGRTTYYHQILAGVIAHPNLKQVIPLCPEPISKPDGNKKNDCERNAMNRFLHQLKKEHPKLKMTIVSDALSANAPQINQILSLGYDFIINVKPDGNSSLFEWLNGVKLETAKMTVGKNEYEFHYINGVPLNGTKNAPEVNFVKCHATETKGRKVCKKTFTWTTSHTITKENVYTLMQGGRARWKVENETFNTLKNQGYQFEHNFGHGKKNLHTVFTLLMMLAFLIDQIQEAACGLFQAALTHLISRKRFWERMRGLFDLCFINSWEDMLKAMGPNFPGATLSFDTS